MTFDYFSNKNSFDSIEDPVKNNWGPYWHLSTKSYEPFCWNTEVFTYEEIEKILVIGNRLNVSRSETGLGKDCLEHRRSFNSWIYPNEHTSWIYERLSNLIQQNNQLFFNFDLTMLENLQFTYYSSSPDEYEGGELKLYNSSEPDIIKKERGLVVTFPSYTLHEVTPVTKGDRYSLVAWVHGPAFK